MNAAITAPAAGSESHSRRLRAAARLQHQRVEVGRARRTPRATRGPRRGRVRSEGPCRSSPGSRSRDGRVLQQRAPGGRALARGARGRSPRCSPRRAPRRRPTALPRRRGRSPRDRVSPSVANAAASPRSPPKRSAGSPVRRVERELAAARELAPVVGEHLARDGVEPWQRLCDAPWQLAPRDGERLGGEILDVVTRRPAREIRADRGVMFLVDRAELLLVAHTRNLSRITQDLQPGRSVDRFARGCRRGHARRSGLPEHASPRDGDRSLPARRVRAAVLLPRRHRGTTSRGTSSRRSRRWSWARATSPAPTSSSASPASGGGIASRSASCRSPRSRCSWRSATFAHLDRFDTQHVAFWIWVGLYVTTPVLVPLAWWRNRATDPGTPEPGEPPLPPHVRTRCSSSARCSRSSRSCCCSRRRR